MINRMNKSLLLTCSLLCNHITLSHSFSSPYKSNKLKQTILQSYKPPKTNTEDLITTETTPIQKEINKDVIIDTTKFLNNEPTTLQEKLSNFFYKDIMLGIEPKPEIIAIMTIYFVEGAISLSRLAQTFLLKDTLQLGPAETTALSGLFTLPWTIKPIYGFLSDSIPIFGYRRRSYLILVGIIGCISYLTLGYITSTPFMASQDTNVILQGVITSLVISSGCIAFSDVVADGIVVQKTRDSKDSKLAGGLQSLCWGSAAIGGLIASYFSGSLLEVMSPSDVFTLSSVLPLFVALIALFISEQPVTSGEIDPNRTVSNQIQSLWSAIKLPQVWKPTLFIFLWQATPTSGNTFLYFMTNELHIGPEFLGQVRFITSLASFVGIWCYQRYLRDVPIKNILFWTSIVSAPIGLLQLVVITHFNQVLGIPDTAFVLGDDVALTLLGNLSFLPILVLAAKICPPGVEAVLFATLMSIFNAAGTVGTEMGALLTSALDVTESNFDNLGLLTIICNVSSLMPLLFLGLLDDFGGMSTSQMEDQEEDAIELLNGDEVIINK